MPEQIDKQRLLVELRALEAFDFVAEDHGVTLNVFEQIALREYMQGIKEGLGLAIKLVEGWEASDV